MYKINLILSSAFIVLAVAVFACTANTTHKEPLTPNMTKEEKIKRGEYLVRITGCDDCHSPKRMGAMGPEVDPALRLSGFSAKSAMPAFDSNLVKKGIIQFNGDLTAAAGPWGISFAGNLTSDATGAGSWQEGNFINSIRKGKFKGLDGSRNLLPPMPWFNLANMPDEDLKAMFAFLQSTKPIENVVPAPKQFADILVK